MSQSLTKFTPADLTRLDDLVKQSGLSVSQGASGSITEAVQMAETMDVLRTSFNDAMMEYFLKLMNTRLGFLTDKDPNKAKSWKDGKPLDWKGNLIVPYGKEVVRDCVIEALLRGLKPVGNQFNIISGGCYTTREGYTALIKKVDRLEDFSPMIGIPRKTDTGTFCNCQATWKIAGQTFRLGDKDAPISIPVKVDDFSTADAVIGKATRKFYKRVYEKMTGIETPDGEVGDDIIAPVVDVKTVKTDAPTTEKNVTPVGVDQIRALLQKSKLSEDQLLGFLKTVKRISLTIETIDDIKPEILADVAANWETLSPEVRLVEV